MLESPPVRKKIPVAKLAVGAVILAVLAAVVLQLVGWRTAWDESSRILGVLMDFVAHAGPAVFYSAMALLPVIGAPMFPFCLGAGSIFGPQLGTPLAIALGLLAITINVTISYWLARRWLRPLLTSLLARWGYSLPQVESGDMTDLIVLLRVTPGPPFFVQNYLLGLADAPFGRYLLLTCAIQWPINIGFMLFGNALRQGRGGVIMTAIGVIAAFAVAIHFVRKRMAKKKVAA